PPQTQGPNRDTNPRDAVEMASFVVCSTGMTMRTHVLYSVLIILAGFWGVNALEGPALARFTFSEPHMGTLFKIIVYAPDETTAKKAVQEAFDRVAELNRIMSDYLEDSELMKLCKKAGGDPVPVSEDLFKVL